MPDYQDFPPQTSFMRVLKHCPRAALLYTQIWKKRNKNSKIMISRYSVIKQYAISPTIFKNFLRELAQLHLVSFDDDDDKFVICIAGSSSDGK